MTTVKSFQCAPKKNEATETTRIRLAKLAFNNMNYKEVGSMFGAAVGTVHSAIHREYINERSPKAKKIREYIDRLPMQVQAAR